jgi:hypothetical protein
MAAMDLEQHGWRSRFNGFPIYGHWEDGEEDLVVGFSFEPDWVWADLSDIDKTVVRDYAASLQVDPRGRDLTWDQAFPVALAEYAIACPHEWSYHEPVFRECKWCRVSEQLPGRVVTIDGKRMRVPDPPPSRWRVPRVAETTFVSSATLESSMIVDEYEWMGSGYRKISSS